MALTNDCSPLSGETAPALSDPPTDDELEVYKNWLISELGAVGALVITRRRASRQTTPPSAP